ncbi:MAG TPA: oxidative damage protection protein [Burkholderiaceae bacterium]|nr:oxidative damage protection protein [Burkholderiaceae bacterium]
MARMVQCVKLKKEAPGLDFPPYPGDLGAKIWRHVSKEAWEQWIDIQTRLVNENRLNLADARARKYLEGQMQEYLFEGADIEAQGYVPPSQ